jgi:hypothetical protein
MDENRFFRWLWRVNAILITLGLILLIGDLAYRRVISGWLNPAPESFYNLQTYRTSETGELIADAKWRYGAPQQLAETSVLLPLLLIEEGAGARQSNLLLINTDKLEEARWIWPENPHRVWANPLEVNEEVIAVLYETVDEEGHIAQGLTTQEESGLNIYLAYPGGAELTPILKEVDRVIGYTVIEVNYLVIFYTKAGEGYSMKVNLSDFSVIEQITLPAIPGE